MPVSNNITGSGVAVHRFEPDAAVPNQEHFLRTGAMILDRSSMSETDVTSR